MAPCMQEQSQALKAKVQSLLRKGAVEPSSTHSQPPFCGAQKWRWIAPNNQSENFEQVPQITLLQNGGAIYGTKRSMARLFYDQSI